MQNLEQDQAVEDNVVPALIEEKKSSSDELSRILRESARGHHLDAISEWAW